VSTPARLRSADQGTVGPPASTLAAVAPALRALVLLLLAVRAYWLTTAGLACLVVSGFTVTRWAGWLALGLAALFLEWRIDQSRRPPE
jgi:hypothetical protein